MNFSIKSPAKTILFGEHYVVYGAKAVVGAIEPFNQIDIYSKKTDRGEGFLQYKTTQSDYDIQIRAKDVMNKRECNHMIEAVYFHYLNKYLQIADYSISTEVSRCWPLKGVGNSASLSSAIAFGLELLADKPVDKISSNDIYEAAQRGELVANGPQASGVDAAAVSRGGLMTFEKRFGFEQESDEVVEMDFKISLDWEFILVDTHITGETKAKTVEQVARFAEQHGVRVHPKYMSREQRLQITKDYDKICEHAIDALKRGDMPKVAKLMDENQVLLHRAGMSSFGIEKAIEIAKQNGARGAKLSGAGGVGGAIICLCEKKDVKIVSDSLERMGFKIHPFAISEKGTHII
jgi:mevalonate kinase